MPFSTVNLSDIISINEMILGSSWSIDRKARGDVTNS